MNRLRILAIAYACDPMRGSESGVGWGWVNAIAADHDITVVTADYNAAHIEQYQADHTSDSINNPRFLYVVNRPWHYCPQGIWLKIEDSVAKPLMNLAYNDWLRHAFKVAKRATEKEHFDLVHLITFVGWRFPGRFYKLGIPFVWGPIGGLKNTPWRLLPILGLQGAIYYAGRNLINSLQLATLPGPRRALRAANHGVVAATSEIKEELRSRFRVDSQVISEVGPPDFTIVTPSQRNDGEVFRICWSGQHLPGKALQLLLHATALLPADSQFSIEILGDGACTQRWRALAARLGVAHSCKWHGWLHRDISLEVMRNSHVFVITSLKDLTSTVAVEAVSLGVPVISLDHCGFADLVTKECGIKIYPGFAKQIASDLASALTTLYRDEPLRRRLSQGAILRSRDYSWHSKMKALDRIYQHSLGSSIRIETPSIVKRALSGKTEQINTQKIRDDPAVEDELTETSQTVAVVILNWNGGDDIVQCIESAYQSSHDTLEVVIVDNGSTDGSSAIVRDRFPRVHFITNPTNLGFAAGSNQGIEWALAHQIPYILLLNGDARLGPNAIRELVAVAVREKDSVIACPRIYLGGASSESGRLWFVSGSVKLWAGLFQNPAFDEPVSPHWSEPMNMGYASGCCMLIPASILRNIGMFDISFFAYCEDIDFSLRAHKAGFQLRYVPEAHLWHGSSRPTQRTRTATYRYLSTRNNLWVVRKHGSSLEFFTCLCLLPVRSLFRIARLVTAGNWDSIAAEIKGIKDGLLSPVSS